MDYKDQIEQAKHAAVKWREEHPIVGVGELRVDCMVDDLCRSIIELLSRAEAAERELDESIRDYNILHEKYKRELALRKEAESMAEKMESHMNTYETAFNEIVNKPDCNTCSDKECKHKPMIGQVSRFNCPLWKGKKK